MKQQTFSYTQANAAIWLLVALIVLSSCAIEGGVPEPSAQPTAAPLAPATNTTAATAVAQRTTTWTVGLLEAPQSLYPYQPNATLQRVAAPVTELLFPAPILVHNYGYTSTGVLERIPTLENGDAERRKADVFLDAAGNITTTATQVITQVDQLVVTYHWNPKLRWSDGTPLTADDSVFAYELARVAPPNDDARDKLDQTVRYERVDDHTTRATLRPDYVGANYFMNVWTPLPRHVLKDVDPAKLPDSPFAQAPLGYGPYRITSRSAGEIRLARNEHYFGPRPLAEYMVVAFSNNLNVLRANLLNGNLDVIASDRVSSDVIKQLDQDAKSKQARVSYMPSPIWEHIDFNLDVKLLQDIRVRRAIAFGTNRQAMVDALYNGRTPVLDSWIMPGESDLAGGAALTRYPYQPDEARRLLDEAGYLAQSPDGLRIAPDGLTMTLQLMTTEGNPVRQAVAQRFREDMRTIGIEIEIVALPNEQLFDRDGPLFLRQFQLALFGWGAGPEPGGLTLWSCAAVPSEQNGWTGENIAGWCFRDADRAIRRAVTALDPTERRDAYLLQQQLWTQESPVLPLFQRMSLVLVAPGVSGPQPDAFAPITWNIATWKRE